MIIVIISAFICLNKQKHLLAVIILKNISFVLKNDSLKFRLLQSCLENCISVLLHLCSFSMNQMQQEKELTENILKVVSTGSHCSVGVAGSGASLILA